MVFMVLSNGNRNWLLKIVIHDNHSWCSLYNDDYDWDIIHVDGIFHWFYDWDISWLLQPMGIG